MWTACQIWPVENEEGVTMVEYAAFTEHISKLEGELKVAVDQEAEVAQRLDSERQRRVALDQELHEARREATRLMLDEASQTRTAMRVEAESEADQVTKEAFDRANEMVTAARRRGKALVDAGRKEARALLGDAPRRMADLDTEHRELTCRLGAMETIYQELVATLKLVAEISTEELVETQDSLKQLDLRETEQPPTEPNSEQTTFGSAPQDELPVSARAQADYPIQEAQEEADELVHEARAEASREKDQLEPPPDSVAEADDDDREELAVIIDDRDLKERRSRYERWLSLDRENRARHEEATLRRFSRVLSSGNSVEGADPKEVEARIRNLTHGTNSE